MHMQDVIGSRVTWHRTNTVRLHLKRFYETLGLVLAAIFEHYFSKYIVLKDAFAINVK